MIPSTLFGISGCVMLLIYWFKDRNNDRAIKQDMCHHEWVEREIPDPMIHPIVRTSPKAPKLKIRDCPLCKKQEHWINDTWR